MKKILFSILFVLGSVSGFSQSYETQFAKPLNKVLDGISELFNVSYNFV